MNKERDFFEKFRGTNWTCFLSSFFPNVVIHSFTKNTHIIEITHVDVYNAHLYIISSFSISESVIAHNTENSTYFLTVIITELFF